MLQVLLFLLASEGFACDKADVLAISKAARSDPAGAAALADALPAKCGLPGATLTADLVAAVEKAEEKAIKKGYDGIRPGLHRTRAMALDVTAPDSDDAVGAWYLAGIAERSLGRHDRAIAILVELVPRAATLYGEDSEEAWLVKEQLALALVDAQIPQGAALLEQVVAWHLETHPDDPAATVSLLWLTRLLAQGARWEEAIPLYVAVLPLAPKAGADAELVATLTEELAYSYRMAGQLEDAVRVYEEVIALRKSMGGPLATIGARVALGSTLVGAGRPDEAVGVLEEALAIAREAEAAELVPTLQKQVAVALGDSGRYEESLAMYQAALDATIALEGPESVAAGQVWLSMAVALADLGRATEGLEAARRGAEIVRARPDAKPSTVIAALNNLAGLLGEVGRNREALAIFEEVLAYAEATLGPDDPHVATVLNNYTAVMQVVGRTAETLPLRERALSIQLRAVGPDHPETGLQLANLGSTLWSLGRHAEALPYLERALAVYTGALGPDHPLTISVMGNVASCLDDVGRDEEGLAMHRKVVELQEKIQGPDHPDVAVALGNLASALHDGDRAAEALPLSLRALAIAEKALGPDHPETLMHAQNVASARSKTGDFPGALAMSRRVLESRSRTLGSDHAITGQAALWVSRIAWAAGDEAAARAALDDALPALRASREQASLRSFDERMKQGAAFAWEAFVLAQTVDPEHSYDIALLARGWASDPAAGAVCDESTDAAAIRACACARTAREARAASLDAALVGPLAECIEEAPTTAADVAERQERVRTDPIAASRRAEEVAVRALGRAHPVPPPPTRAALQAALPEDGALVEMVRWSPQPLHQDALPARYVAYVVRRSGVSRIDLGEAAPIDAAVEAWRAAASSPVMALASRSRTTTSRGYRAPDLARSGADLSALVLVPLLPAIGTATRVWIAPDAALGGVGFGALPRGSRPWSDTTRVLYVTSGADLLEPARASGKGAVVLGAPTYGVATGDPAAWEALRGGSTCRAPGWDDLPGAASEMALVEGVYAGATRLTGEGATEEALSAAVRGKAVVHLATHACYGVTDPVDPLTAGVVVLAGANEPRSIGPSDGYLTGWEVMGLPLGGVQLVALSACETARGDTAAEGQGVLGLRFAALHAGSAAVIGSLWPVDDAATAAFFTSFYGSFAVDGDADRALATATATVRADPRWTHPYYWAAWTLAVRGPARR